MGFLNKLFGKTSFSNTNYINLDLSLGNNVLLSGNSPAGKTSIIRNYTISAINNGGGLLIIKNANAGFSVVPNVYNSYQSIFGIDTSDNAFTEQFNPFANLNDTQMVELLFNIFHKYSEFENSHKMKFKQYLAKIVYFAKASGKTIKLNELQDYTLDKLEDMNARSRLPDVQKDQNERFFDSLRQDISILESYFYDFANNNIGFILSGNKSLEEIVNTGKAIEVNLDFSARKEESELFLSVLSDKLCKFDFNRTTKTCLSVVVDDIPNDAIMNSNIDKLVSMSSDKLYTIYSIMDIATISEKTNVFVDQADSLFFFQQNSVKNKNYCADFFGKYDKEKITTSDTYGTSRGRSSNFGQSSSYGFNSGSNRSQSVSRTTEKDYVYAPDEFGMLTDKKCIYFFRSNHTHNYLNL